MRHVLKNTLVGPPWEWDGFGGGGGEYQKELHQKVGVESDLQVRDFGLRF